MSREVETWAREQKTGDPARKAVLMALANYADPHGRNCYPSIPRVAEEVEVSVRTVQRHLKVLEEQGFVVAERRQRADGSFSSNLYVFPGYKTPRLSHRAAPVGGGANLTPGGDNLSPAGDAAVTGVVTMVSPQETPTESFPPTAEDKSPAVPPQGGLPLDLNEEQPEPEAPKRGSRIPGDWTPPPIDTLPPPTQAVVRQWPAGAYEFVAIGFTSHWAAEIGARASKRDWDKAWVKWLSGEGTKVMAMARNGIKFAEAAAAIADPEATADIERLQRCEDSNAAKLRGRLRADLGEAAYDGWLKPTSIGICRNGDGWYVNVICRSELICGWVRQHFFPTIRAMACKVLETDDVEVHCEDVGDR